MKPLERGLRNRLEKTVKDARDIAESAAAAVLGQLGLGDAKSPSHLGSIEQELRRKLRIHGRQLGDVRDEKTGKQDVARLTEEVSYEHWHRMLFARFLAENNLLMYPDPDGPVPVTLEECEDLAVDEGAKNGWELAARFASRMLPQIFRPDSPVFQLVFPPEHQQKLERLVAELPDEVFKASDSLGWVYQFWQTKKKDEVNASEVKIGARELPVVTQLFTEPYMVSFLLDNSLGAWWAGHRLSKDDLHTAKDEGELRKAASIPVVSLEYLRFVKNDDASWIPAAGTFDAWPKTLKELKTLDPCCGSGHFLVAAFLMLVPMRMELEKLSARDAVDAVLRENIHGLEIDQRCVELAAFALALTAWKFPDAGGYRALPDLNLACSGLSISMTREKWKLLAHGREDLKVALGWMYDEFKAAPVLGSLLNPSESDFSRIVKWKDLSNTLKQAFVQESDYENSEAGVVAHGLVKASEIMSEKFNWIITNVPYRASNDLDDGIRNYVSKNYRIGATDLSTAFLLRIFSFISSNGNGAIVIPQSWLIQPSYKELRNFVLCQKGLNLIARLGPGAFQEISGEVVNVLLMVFSGSKICQYFGGIDCDRNSTFEIKKDTLKSFVIENVDSQKQLINPDFVIFLGKRKDGITLLGEFASSVQGIKTGEDDRFKRKFWEFGSSFSQWIFLQSTIGATGFFGGLEHLVFWDCNGEHLARKQGMTAWGKCGIAVSQMSDLPCCIYLGGAFDSNMTAIVLKKIDDFEALLDFALKGDLSIKVRAFDQSIKPTNSSFEKIEFSIGEFSSSFKNSYPLGCPKPFSNDSTQWLFHGHPFGNVTWKTEVKRLANGILRSDDTVLQVALVRLLGYQWPAELDDKMELDDLQREWVKKCKTLASHVDDDGIVCIPPVRGEASAAERLLNLLVDAHGPSWTNDILAELLKNSDHGGKSLETWLRDKFFSQHCKIFQNRPFIWHIWDGLRDGFSVLVNYHKLDHKNLETLIYTYLGDWISRMKQDLDQGIDGAEEKIAAAESLKKKLELILEGESPYDIFVRWKPLDKQPIGWKPDLNDGVRLNIRPFMSVPDVGKKGAGIFRDKPNIKWEKDRGRDVESAPWYHLFKGDRINDHHLTLAEKISRHKVGRETST
ncbi:MAG: SAM-dependent DNA methyltransferase [Candidatus Riflebacteria bacterium]|nr:SAM-dependent DNA methyltransferase [Candidatus Riflebacteria bacterium]